MSRHDQHIDPRTLSWLSPGAVDALNYLTVFLIGCSLAAALFYGWSQ